MQSLQIRIMDFQRNLEEKKMQNDTSSLWQVLGDVLARVAAGPCAAGPRTLGLGAAGPRAFAPEATDPTAAGAGDTASSPE